jgi:hypothetical protein
MIGNPASEMAAIPAAGMFKLTGKRVAPDIPARVSIFRATASPVSIRIGVYADIF